MIYRGFDIMQKGKKWIVSKGGDVIFDACTSEEHAYSCIDRFIRMGGK